MADERLLVRVHVSALDDANVVQAGLEAWLGDVEISRETSASHHGPTMITFFSEISRRAELRRAVEGLGPEVRSTLVREVEERLDDAGGLHYRLALDALVAGECRLSPPGSSRSVKVQHRVAVYPGQTAVDRLREALSPPAP